MRETAPPAPVMPADIDRMLAELHQIAGPLLTALERSGTATVVTNPRLPDNPVIFVNAGFTRLTGYTVPDVLGRNCRFLQGPETDPATREAIREAVRAGGMVNTEIVNYRQDGTPFRNALCVTPLPGRDGVIAFFLATQSDITPAPLPDATEAALDRVHARLHTVLIHSGRTAAWEWTLATGRIVGDSRFAELYGVTPQQAAQGITARQFFAPVHPQDQIRMRLAIGGMQRGAELLSKEYRMLEGSTVRWVHARARCTYDERERPISFSGVLTDITDQKRVEEQLRIAQTAGGVGTFEYAFGFATMTVSTQFCRLLGLHASADLPVSTINGVVLAGDPPLLDATHVAAAGTISRIETRIRRPDNGQLRWLARRGEYLRDAETTGLRFSGVIYDITEAKDTEEKLRLLNESLETRVAERTRERDLVWRTSQDLFVLCTLDGQIRSANPAWATVLGHGTGTVLSQPFEELVHPDDRVVMQERFAELRDGRVIRDLDLRMRAADGSTLRYSWHCIPEGDQVYAAGRDMTERHALEEQLRQSQKMEAVGQLTGGIAHDFNNLLTGIAGSLELLGTRISQGRLVDVERYINAAQGASKRAAALTHRLLAFSRQQTLEPRAANINTLVSGLEELIRRTVGPEITVETVPAAGLWSCMVDVNQLENALLNLCINARDAMPDGGRITIETANLSLNARAAQARDLPAGAFVCLSVTDTGSGMSPEVIERAFDPFFTTKPLGQGTGLGLSMIYGFVRQSGGQVRIRSAIGQGTSMRLYLPPYHGDDDHAEPQAAVASPAPASRGETVLVVDDEPTVRMLVRDVLEELGYTAIEAADGAAGVDVLASRARIDLLVTDVGLPGGMNGRDVAKAGRTLRPGLKVLFITGYAQDPIFHEDSGSSAVQVMTKPFAMDALANRIRDMISGA